MLQQNDEGVFTKVFNSRRALADWIDEFHTLFPTMPCSIRGMGLQGIKPEALKKLEQAAVVAEQERVAAEEAAKKAKEEATAKTRLADELKERIATQVSANMAAATKLQLCKQQQAQEFIDFQEGTKLAAAAALTAGIQECMFRYGYKGDDVGGERADYFDQGFSTITGKLSNWLPHHSDMQPAPAILLLSLLSMTLDTSTPFEFKPEEWRWLSEFKRWTALTP